MQPDWPLATVQVAPDWAVLFLLSATEYVELLPMAEPKLKDASVIVPAAGVVVQLPDVWLAQFVEIDVYQEPLLHGWLVMTPLV